MPLGSQPTESDPAPRLGVSENGHMHWPHWTGSGRMVSHREVIGPGRHQVSSDKGAVNVPTSPRFGHNGQGGLHHWLADSPLFLRGSVTNPVTLVPFSP
jgi:hypothetical protein